MRARIAALLLALHAGLAGAAAPAEYRAAALGSALSCPGGFPYQCPNNPAFCCSGPTGCCASSGDCSFAYTCGSMCSESPCGCSSNGDCIDTFSSSGSTPFCGCNGVCGTSPCNPPPPPPSNPSPSPSPRGGGGGGGSSSGGGSGTSWTSLFVGEVDLYSTASCSGSPAYSHAFSSKCEQLTVPGVGSLYAGIMCSSLSSYTFSLCQLGCDQACGTTTYSNAGQCIDPLGQLLPMGPSGMVRCSPGALLYLMCSIAGVFLLCACGCCMRSWIGAKKKAAAPRTAAAAAASVPLVKIVTAVGPTTSTGTGKPTTKESSPAPTAPAQPPRSSPADHSGWRAGPSPAVGSMGSLQSEKSQPLLARFCTECGERLSGAAKFCAACGSRAVQ